MPRKNLTSLEQISEINMTPLMDLTFILLITFIITFPLIEQGVPVELPKGDAEPVEDATHFTLTLNRQGELFLDDSMMSLDNIVLDLQRAQLSDPSASVYLRADETLPYGDVIKVMQRLHSVGVTRMALMTQSETQ